MKLDGCDSIRDVMALSGAPLWYELDARCRFRKNEIVGITGNVAHREQFLVALNGEEGDLGRLVRSLIDRDSCNRYLGLNGGGDTKGRHYVHCVEASYCVSVLYK
jgi:hypothetical protein